MNYKNDKNGEIIMDAKNSLKNSFANVRKIASDYAKATSEVASKAAATTGRAASKAAKAASEYTKNVVVPTTKKAANEVSTFAKEKVVPGAIDAKDKTLALAIKGKEELIKAVDKNGNGEIDIEDIIIMALSTPGVSVDRESFLKKELFKLYPEHIVKKAIDLTPMKAGIEQNDINKIADEIIKVERNIVSGVSAVLGAPGGAAMLATIPADIAQYYGCMLRATQKLLYLYGFPQIEIGDETAKIDSETLNILTLCLGIMYGVSGANNAIKILANGLSRGVEKKLMSAALTKGTFYPIVKKVASWFSVKMTKEVFAGFFKNSIPILGGVIGGSITFFSFKPCCDRLKLSLMDTRLSNPDRANDEAIDIDAVVVSEEDDVIQIEAKEAE